MFLPLILNELLITTQIISPYNYGFLLPILNPARHLLSHRRQHLISNNRTLCKRSNFRYRFAEVLERNALRNVNLYLQLKLKHHAQV